MTNRVVSVRSNASKFAKENDLETAFDTRKVTFTVVDSEDANAFVLPGNHVFCKSFFRDCVLVANDDGEDDYDIQSMIKP